VIVSAASYAQQVASERRLQRRSVALECDSLPGAPARPLLSGELQIFIFECQLPSLFVKFDGVSQSLFCLHHAAVDARIARKVESDHCNLGMYCLCPEQNGFRLLNAFGASKR
jgi:hypothetical protein